MIIIFTPLYFILFFFLLFFFFLTPVNRTNDQMPGAGEGLSDFWRQRASRSGTQDPSPVNQIVMPSMLRMKKLFAKRRQSLLL